MTHGHAALLLLLLKHKRRREGRGKIMTRVTAPEAFQLRDAFELTEPLFAGVAHAAGAVRYGDENVVGQRELTDCGRKRNAAAVGCEAAEGAEADSASDQEAVHCGGRGARDDPRRALLARDVGESAALDRPCGSIAPLERAAAMEGEYRRRVERRYGSVARQTARRELEAVGGQGRREAAE